MGYMLVASPAGRGLPAPDDKKNYFVATAGLSEHHQEHYLSRTMSHSVSGVLMLMSGR